MFRLATLLLVMFAVAGCDTANREIQREQVSQRQTITELQEKQETLNVSLQNTQEENARLRQQIDEMRTELQASRQTSSTYAGDIARLDELVQKMNSAREKDRQAILDEVSSELARMSQRTASTHSTHSTSSGQAASGQANSGQTGSPRPSSGPAAGPSASPHPPKKAASEVGYEHIVKKGETLFAIAKAYGIPASAIAKANSLKETSPLKTGQTLFIPKK